MRLSISQKLLFYFILLSFAGVISIGSYGFYKARTALISRTYNQLISVRIEKKNRLKEFFNGSIKDLNTLIKFDETQELFNELIEPNSLPTTHYNTFLQAFFHSNELYESISFYVDPQRAICFPITGNDSLNSPIKFQASNSTMVEIKDKLSSMNITVIDNYVEQSSGKVKILLAKEILYKGNPIYIILKIPIESINNIMINNNPNNGLGKSGEIYLVGEDYLLRSSSRFQKNSILSTTANTEGVRRGFNKEVGTKIILDYRSIKVLSTFEKIDLPYLNWVILSEIDLEEAMVSINQVRNSIIYLIIIISLLTFGVVVLIASTLTRPIKALKNETETIAGGKYGKIITLQSKDELGDLINAFNKMTLELKEQAKKLDIEKKLRLTSMIDGQEIERQRLSRELHDSLGQQILAIKLRLENAVHADADKAKEIISSTMELFTLTAKEIRSISNNLMPAVLSEFGLETALKNLTRELASNLKIEVQFVSDLSWEKLNSKIETYIFRICQEAFNNIAKYAKATKVRVVILIEDELLILQIEDNGLGFVLDEAHLAKGNGLSNIKVRSQLLNGKCKFITEPNKGTHLQIEIPITQKKKDYDKDSFSR